LERNFSEHPCSLQPSNSPVVNVALQQSLQFPDSFAQKTSEILPQQSLILAKPWIGFEWRRYRIAAALSSAAIEKYPDEIWEADNKHYLEPLEFHSGNELFLWPRVGVSSGCDRFLHFPPFHFVPTSSRPSDYLASFTSFQRSSSTSGRCWP
jgi:hypothetical protein